MFYQNDLLLHVIAKILLIIEWTNEFTAEIVNALCDYTIMNDIINVDTKTFTEVQHGINSAIEELNR